MLPVNIILTASASNDFGPDEEQTILAVDENNRNAYVYNGTNLNELGHSAVSIDLEGFIGDSNVCAGYGLDSPGQEDEPTVYQVERPCCDR